MTIGEVAKASGVSASAIRYYEANGVLPKPSRRNGVRQYGPGAVDELKVLRFFRESGISIRGLARVAAQARGTTAHRLAWSDVLRSRIDDLDVWMREAEKTRDTLERVIACTCDGESSSCEARRAARL